MELQQTLENEGGGANVNIATDIDGDSTTDAN